MSRFVVLQQTIAVSRVYQRGKTQIPKDVRLKLGLRDGDKVLWLLEEGKIVVEKT